MFKLALVLLSVSMIQAANLLPSGRIPVKTCGSPTGVVDNLDVLGCVSTPCPLIKGNSSTWSLTFTTNEDTSKLTSQVFGVLFGLPVPFPLPESDNCKLGAVCPAKKGDQNTITISLPILSLYPSLSLDVKWQIVDERNKNVVCLTVPVKISN